MAVLLSAWTLFPTLVVPIFVCVQDSAALLRNQMTGWNDIIDLTDPSTSFAVNALDSVSIVGTTIVAAGASALMLEVLTLGKYMSMTVR